MLLPPSIILSTCVPAGFAVSCLPELRQFGAAAVGMQAGVVALWSFQTSSEQPSLSPPVPALLGSVAAPAFAADPASATTPTHTKVRNVYQVCFFVSKIILNVSIVFGKEVNLLEKSKNFVNILPVCYWSSPDVSPSPSDLAAPSSFLSPNAPPSPSLCSSSVGVSPLAL